jgi:hypothetical protein
VEGSTEVLQRHTLLLHLPHLPTNSFRHRQDMVLGGQVPLLLLAVLLAVLDPQAKLLATRALGG